MQHHFKHKIEEHLGQLAVGKRQGPQPQVGGRVGNRSQHKFDGLDGLMNEGLSKRVVMVLGPHFLDLLVD